MKMPYAEKVNFWKTSKSSPDKWIEKAIKQIENLGGKVLAEHFGNDISSGRSAFLLGFTIGNDTFKFIWPVLKTKSGTDERAARVQAATTLYHVVKAKCLAAVIIGARAAFFESLLLPDKRTMLELSTPDIMKNVPKQLVMMGKLNENI
ncbi:MAG TPA: hypothetical protein ENH82_19290 [bacterium]|nr:hypothetical protein [bacterium]